MKSCWWHRTLLAILPGCKGGVEALMKNVMQVGRGESGLTAAIRGTKKKSKVKRKSSRRPPAWRLCNTRSGVYELCSMLTLYRYTVLLYTM